MEAHPGPKPIDDPLIRHIAAKHGMPIPEDYVVRSEEPEDEATRDLTSEEVWRQAREIAAGLPSLMPPGPVEGGFLGNPPLDERYPDADRILGQGMLD